MLCDVSGAKLQKHSNMFIVTVTAQPGYSWTHEDRLPLHDCMNKGRPRRDVIILLLSFIIF